MYKALELYPLADGSQYEKVINTRYTYARYKAIDYYLLMQGKTLADLELYTGRREFNGFCSIDEYLRLGEFFGWDLSRDINYAFANVIYSPEAILERYCDVCKWKRITPSRYKELAGNIGMRTEDFIAGVHYGGEHRPRLYGWIMFALMDMEQEAGISGALDFER